MKKALLPILCLFVMSCGRGNVPPFEPQQENSTDKVIPTEDSAGAAFSATKKGVCWNSEVNSFKDFSWDLGDNQKLIWAELEKGKYQLVSQTFYGSFYFASENALLTNEFIVSDATPAANKSLAQNVCKSDLTFANKDFRTIKTFEVSEPTAENNNLKVLTKSVRWVKFIFEATAGAVLSENLDLDKDILAESPFLSTKVISYHGSSTTLIDTRVLRPSDERYEVYTRELQISSTSNTHITLSKSVYSFTPAE